MPSTYSSNLRVELIQTGEQALQWGVTNNTNLGTILEDAISGYVPVTITSANQALTIADGAADQARNMVVELLTSTSANFNVYVPPVEKVYVVKNSTSYIATVYCSTVAGNTTAAGAGISIPANAVCLLRTNGGVVYEQVSHIGSLTLGAALPVGSGGSGVTSATAYSVLCGGTTSTGPFQSVSGLGSAGQVLTSNGAAAMPTWQTPQNFDTGTAMMFVQTTAPTGWTKDTTHNNKALRVVSGTASSGGSVAFTTAFTSQAVAGTVDATTLTTTQIPAHGHSRTGSGGANNSGYANSPFAAASGFGTPVAVNSANTGGGSSHTHTFTGTSINLAVQYVDVIIATKN
jgi:hypothetical protein